MATSLYHDAAERQRLLDLTVRLQPAYGLAVAIMAVPMLLGGPVFGWAAGVPLLLAILVFLGAAWQVRRSPRPERLVLAACVAGILGTLGCIWVADGPKEYLFALPVFPMLAMAPLFAQRVSVGAAVLTCLGLTGVALGSHGDAVRAMPPILILPVMLILVVTLGAMASRNAESINRSVAVVDPLTGVLNRVALQTRAAELALQAGASGARVGLIVVDLDHFKAVNDEHGHAKGDEVLIEVASRLQAQLAGEQGLFRFGGEEFVILLPSTTAAAALSTAEALRAVLAGCPVGGLPITASLGVAVAPPGAGFDYASVFQAADAAMYRAKAAGRDRVEPAEDATDDDAVGPVAVAQERRAAARAAQAARAKAKAAGAAGPGAPVERPDDGFDVRLRSADGNWLVRDAVERGHVVDLLQRCAKDSDFNSMISLVALLICGLWLDWWGLIPVLASGAFWKVCTTVMPTSRRPEFAALTGLLAIIASAGASMTLANQPILFALPLGGLVTFGACATFRWRGALLIAVVAVASTVIAALVMDAAAVAATPFVLAFPVALLAVTSLLGHAMGRTARRHRVASISDGLTGTLNRAALEARIPQLVQQSLTSRSGLALLMVDIDHFKAVNDEHGHDVGDQVLSQVAYRLRRSLRAFDSVYRVGGEEFVIVLTDIACVDATMVAERTRGAVQSAAAAGIDVTISVGVSWSPGGRELDYDDALRLADERLYEAKRTGRNRVVDGESLGELTLLAA